MGSNRRNRPDRLPYLRVEPSDKFAGVDITRLNEGDLEEMNQVTRNGQVRHQVEIEIRHRRVRRGRATAARRRPRDYWS